MASRPRSFRTLAPAWVLLLVCLAATTARAENCLEREKAAIDAGAAPIGILLDSVEACYGRSVDPDAFTVAVRAKFDKPQASAEDLVAALQALAQRVESDSASYAPAEARVQALAALASAATSIAHGAPVGTVDSLSPPKWRVDQGETVPLVRALKLTTTVNAACHDGHTPACDMAVTGARNWLRLTVLAESVVTLAGAPALRERLALAEHRLAMWYAYRDEALPQYPWEWLVNSAYIGRHDDRERDEHHQPIGPRVPPGLQIILLHPGVGLEYRDTASNSSGKSKFQPAIYLEAAGFYKWSWDEETGAMLGGRGISAVVSYTKRDTLTEVGYGLLFHWRKSAELKPFTLAVTKSGGDTSILLNVDLADYVKEKLAYYRQAEANIRDLRAEIGALKDRTLSLVH